MWVTDMKKFFFYNWTNLQNKICLTLAFNIKKKIALLVNKAYSNCFRKIFGQHVSHWLSAKNDFDMFNAFFLRM